MDSREQLAFAARMLGVPEGQLQRKVLFDKVTLHAWTLPRGASMLVHEDGSFLIAEAGVRWVEQLTAWLHGQRTGSADDEDLVMS